MKVLVSIFLVALIAEANMQIEPAHTPLGNRADTAPEAFSLRLDMDWNSTGLNASIQMTPDPPPKAMIMNSSIYQVNVGTDEKPVFTPSELNAYTGDTILFIPVNSKDRVFQVPFDRPCRVDGPLSATNFSRLMYPYLVTNEDPTWFSCQQQKCAHGGNRKTAFVLNPPKGDTANNSTPVNVLQTSGSRPSSSYIGTSPANPRVSAGPSSGRWPTSNGTTASNASIKATGGPSTLGIPFSGRAATMEVSKGIVSLLVVYCSIIGVL